MMPTEEDIEINESKYLTGMCTQYAVVGSPADFFINALSNFSYE